MPFRFISNSQVVAEASKEHGSSVEQCLDTSRQICMYASIHALVPNGWLHEVRAHEWHCRQKWGTEKAYLICLLLFCSVSSRFKPRAKIPMKALSHSPTSAGIASSAHRMTTYILTNHPRHLHVIPSPQTTPYKEQIYRQPSHSNNCTSVNLRSISSRYTQQQYSPWVHVQTPRMFSRHTNIYLLILVSLPSSTLISTLQSHHMSLPILHMWSSLLQKIGLSLQIRRGSRCFLFLGRRLWIWQRVSVCILSFNTNF